MSKPLTALLMICVVGFGLPQGVERWIIKTGFPEGANLAHPRFVSLKDLLTLSEPPGVKGHDPRYKSSRIPSFDNPLGLKEGDIVSTEGYIVLVGYAKDDDDYHVQIREKPSTEPGTDCMIVEVPLGLASHVATKPLRPKFQNLRKWMRVEFRPSSGEFSKKGSVFNNPVYVRITGQLFFDVSHHPHPAGRGMKGMKAVTSWELHPVYRIRFATPPD